jgi:hypothetical protein
MGPFSRTALALLAVGATAASGASSARLAARPRAVARMAFGGRQDESRQIGSAAGRGGQYVSKSPQQQQYEAQQVTAAARAAGARRASRRRGRARGKARRRGRCAFNRALGCSPPRSTRAFPERAARPARRRRAVRGA